MYKKFIIVSLLFICIEKETIFALNLPQEIAQALESGDAKSVSKYFNTSVELIFSESQGVFGKNQAEQILRAFFEKNTGRSERFKYNHLHTNNAKGNVQSYVGELFTHKGVYRVTIFMKDKQIHLMRLESND
jgi:hypothetical protein